MMNLFAKRLMIGSSLAASVFAGAITLSLAVEYKPFGVPDVRRDEYEQKLSSISARNEAIDLFRDKPRPIQALGRRLHDFGYVSVGDELTHAFKLENTGQESLQIVDAKMPAGVSYQLIPKILDGGSAGELVVRWSPKADQLGLQTNLKFSTNDPIDSRFTLTLYAKEKQNLILPERIDLGNADPSESFEGRATVLSQLASDIEITDVKCDAPNFFWNVDSVRLDQAAFRKQSITAGLELLVGASPVEFGKFSMPCEITMKMDGKVFAESTELFGRVRTPITFNHPEMRRDRGLDIGTLNSDQEHQVHVQVRLRGEEHRRLAVLDSKPDELQVELSPLKLKGIYKMTITIPEGCPTTQFNRDDYRGYVEVGDPADKKFSNWLPLYGAVVSLD